MKKNNLAMAKEYEYKLSDPLLIKMHNSDVITITENDLKYTNKNNIDIKRVNGLYNCESKDTVNYRIKDSINNNGTTLDLSHLNLATIPKLPEELYKSIKYLFISENKIETINNLNRFTNLKVVDLCANRLKHISNLPTQLKELHVKHNMLTKLDCLYDCPNLKRLDCADNKLNDLPQIDSLEILICSQNNISQLPLFKHLKKLICSYNSIKYISDYKQLEILDCDSNIIECICDMPNLKELYCSKNQVDIINGFKKIEVIHCYKTNISKIDYCNTLKELICDYRDDFMLSKNFKIKSFDIYKNNISVLQFT